MGIRGGTFLLEARLWISTAACWKTLGCSAVTGLLEWIDPGAARLRLAGPRLPGSGAGRIQGSISGWPPLEAARISARASCQVELADLWFGGVAMAQGEAWRLESEPFAWSGLVRERRLRVLDKDRKELPLNERGEPELLLRVDWLSPPGELSAALFVEIELESGQACEVSAAPPTAPLALDQTGAFLSRGIRLEGHRDEAVRQGILRVERGAWLASAMSLPAFRLAAEFPGGGVVQKDLAVQVQPRLGPWSGIVGGVIALALALFGWWLRNAWLRAASRRRLAALGVCGLPGLPRR